MRGFPKLNLKILQNLQIKVKSKQVKSPVLMLGYIADKILLFREAQGAFKYHQAGYVCGNDVYLEPIFRQDTNPN